MTTAPPPADLDEFRLLRALGRGGMGAVYLAHDTLLDRMVAIKVMTSGGASAEGRRRFLTEARAIARLQHPNVVAVHRVGVTRDGEPYLAQELVRGQSLDRLSLPLAPARALAIAVGVARGLAAAHRRGILHRDVKPANVMLDEADTPRLLDFGLAKLTGDGGGAADAEVDDVGAPVLDADAPVLDASAAATADPSGAAAATADPPGIIDTAAAITLDPAGAPAAAIAAAAVARAGPALTDDGALLGTPRYLAPERWRGEVATARSDLYALGVLLHELVTGAAPYPERDRAALQAAVLDGPPVAPPTIEGVAPGFAAVIADCLARDPAQRPESADEVVHRLERVIAGAPSLTAGDPYPGLASFDAARQGDFLGRGAELAAVIDRLRADPLVTIIGDSGVGKSSLARAGVVPAIEAGQLDDGRRWTAVVVRLGRAPVAALVAACGLEVAPAAPPSAGALARALAGRTGADRGLLLLVDQLEELVTSAPLDERAPAAAWLAALAEGLPGVKVVATLRGDLLTRVAALPGLGPRLVRSLAVLGPLTAAGARDAVAGPAHARGVRFSDTATVDELVAAATARPGALPLVQFTLAALWARRDRARAEIPRDALAAVGGVAGALAGHADRVLAGLAPAARPAARRILLALIGRDQTRATIGRDALVGGDAEAVTALEALVAGRLVIGGDDGDRDAHYQLAHEALIDGWATLRGWLDDAAGQRGRRARLAAAADEWHRHGRRPAHLWSAAQLTDAAGLDELGDRDRAFVTASQRALRRRRVGLGVALAALPLIAGATWLTIRRVDAAERTARVAARVAAADAHEAPARTAAAAAAAGRAQLATWFAAGPTPEAEAAWRAARDQAAAASAGFAAAATELEAALVTGGDQPAVRRRLAGVLIAQAIEAEARFDAAAVDSLLARAALHDPAQHAAWHRPAVLTVDAPGAVALAVARYQTQDGAVTVGPSLARVSGNRTSWSLPAGRYQVAITGGDGLAVVAPVVLARGEALTMAVPPIAAAAVPAGFIYVPAGRFLVGSDDEGPLRELFMSAAPMHARTTAGFLIARDETTYGEWLGYLRALPPDERERRRPRTPDGPVRTMRLDGADPYALVFQPARDAFVAAEGAPLVLAARDRRREVPWERAPVGGVSFEDAQAYAAWLAATGRVPGARLCTELEWERAARGADGRRYPHGARLAPDDANVDITYGRRSDAYGPDAVGSHPASTSPFGVRDLAGNVKEWVIGVDGRPWARGGGYYHGQVTALASTRDPAEASLRLPWLGVRICADAPVGPAGAGAVR